MHLPHGSNDRVSDIIAWLDGADDHLLRSAKGFRAFDAQDKEIGTFDSATAGALLELAAAN